MQNPLNKLYLNSRKLHLILVIPIAVLTLLMAGTGILLKYPQYSFGFIDPNLIRYLHNQLSSFFTIFLGFMTLSGLVMFAMPYLRKMKSRTVTKEPGQDNQDQSNQF